MQLLGHTGLRQLLAQHRGGGPGTALLAGDDDEEYGPRLRTKTKRAKGNNFPPVPNEDGRKLMDGGVFGGGICYRDSLRKRTPRFANKLMNRELGLSDRILPGNAGSVAQVWQLWIEVGRSEDIELTFVGSVTRF